MKLITLRNIIIFNVILLLNLSSGSSLVAGKLTKDQYKSYFEKGKKYYIQKKYEKAVKEWEPLIKTKTINKELKEMVFKSYQNVYKAKSSYIKGMKFYNNNQYPEAKKYFIQATNIYPKYAEANNMIFNSEKYIMIDKYLRIASENINEKKYDEAVSICKRLLIIDLNNQDVQNLLKQALLYLNKEKPGIEMEKVDKLLVKGITFFSNKEYESAQNIFTNVLKLDENNMLAVNYLNTINRIRYRQYLGREFIKFTNIYPKGKLPEEMKFLVKKDLIIEKYLQVVGIYQSTKKYDKAIEMSRNILSLQPDNQDAGELIKQTLLLQIKDKNEEEINNMITKGITHFSNKEYGSAEQIFADILKIEPENYLIINYIDKINQIAVHSDKPKSVQKDISSLKKIINNKKTVPLQKKRLQKEERNVQKSWYMDPVNIYIIVIFILFLLTGLYEIRKE